MKIVPVVSQSHKVFKVINIKLYHVQNSNRKKIIKTKRISSTVVVFMLRRLCWHVLESFRWSCSTFLLCWLLSLSVVQFSQEKLRSSFFLMTLLYPVRWSSHKLLSMYMRVRGTTRTFAFAKEFFSSVKVQILSTKINYVGKYWILPVKLSPAKTPQRKFTDEVSRCQKKNIYWQNFCQQKIFFINNLYFSWNGFISKVKFVGNELLQTKGEFVGNDSFTDEIHFCW